MRTVASLLWVVLVASVLPAADESKGYQKKVPVGNATRLDWTFALANQSLAEPPADWLPDYDSTKQSYELFIPADYNPRKSYPLVLFISAGDEPAGWKSLEPVCKQLGAIFASPHGAGNGTATRKRVRIVLDVLDDVRRRYNVDVDRTYVAGFSGGARIASAIGVALPEYFGGVLAVGGSGDLREEPWLRARAIDRLSVALLTGETDFNRGELERLRGPMLNEVGVRAKVWVTPKLGHAIPPAAQMSEALRWLEDGLKARQTLAKKYPASSRTEAKSREAWADELLEEGKQRLASKETLYSGLMQLKGCMDRWPDTRAGAAAKKLLLEYDAKKDKPWEAEDVAEQRRFLIARARALDAYASGTLPAQYAKMRASMAKQALETWQEIVNDGVDTKAVAEGKKRIPALQKLIEDK